MHCITENCKPVLIPKGNTIKVTISPTINGVPEDFSAATGINATLVESGGVRGIPVKLDTITDHSLHLFVDGRMQKEGVFDLVIKYLKPDVISEGDNSRTLRYFCAVKFYSRPVCESSGNTCPDVEIEPIEIDGEFQIGVTILPDNVAVYDENGDLKIRRNVTLPLGGKLLSTFPDGKEHLLAATNIYPKEDGTVGIQNEISNPYATTNTNSIDRPTVEMPLVNGGKKQTAFLDDIGIAPGGNVFKHGDLSSVYSYIDFDFGLISARVYRINTNEIEIFLSASEDIIINLTSRLSGPATSVNDRQSGVHLVTSEVSIGKIQIGTYVLAEYFIRYLDQCYHITAGANGQYTDADGEIVPAYADSWINIQRLN